MMKFKLSTILLPLLLVACAQAPLKKQRDDSAYPNFATSEAGAASVLTEDEEAYPKLELSSQMLYTFLLADIAAQRGQVELAAQGYLEMAKATRDLRIVRRAAQLAYESRQMEQMLEVLQLWLQLEPSAALPKQMLATVLVSGGKLAEARPYMVELLAADASNAGRNIVQIYPLLARHSDKTVVYKMLQDLAQPYLNIAEMHWVLAQAASAAAQPEVALVEVRRARALNPAWEMPVLLEAQLLLPKTPEAALGVAKIFLDKNAEADEVRLFYARALLEHKQYQESRMQFQHLLKKRPENPELAFAIALLSIQLGELDRAETELKQTLSVGKKDSATVHYYLAQLHEAKKNDTAAMQEYSQVKEGEYVFPSRIRMTYLLVKVGKVDEAREMLHKTTAKDNQQRAQLILTEGQILRDMKKYDLAAKVLNKGLETLPNNPDILYEAAMVADKMGKRDLFESFIRKLIKVAPEHAHAYNAFGYSLLERNERLSEAMQLLERAYQLAPDDPAIMDSMGWGYYRLGNLPKSLEFMRKAYAAFPDPEVAAHLGEVLWHSGAKDEAKKIWQESIKNNPDNAVLQDAIKRFVR